MDTFNNHKFEHNLIKLKDTQDSIANLSAWCLANQQHHDKIVSTWLSVMQRVNIEQRVILFYLANDVVQYSKKKSLPFVDSFAPAFQKAVTLMREDMVRPKIERLFSIWKQRSIYDENFLVELNNLFASDKVRIDITEFQASELSSKMRSCKYLEEDTDFKLKVLNQNHLPLNDIEEMRKSLKDRNSASELIPEVEEIMKKVKNFINVLEAEIKEREDLIELLHTSKMYYADQLNEAKVVVNAYRCFSGRIKGVKRKLEEKVIELPSLSLSPNLIAPSPSPDKVKYNDLSFQGIQFSSGSSFMDGSLMTNNSLAKEFCDSLHAETFSSCYSKSGNVSIISKGNGFHTEQDSTPVLNFKKLCANSTTEPSEKLQYETVNSHYTPLQTTSLPPEYSLSQPQSSDTHTSNVKSQEQLFHSPLINASKFNSVSPIQNVSSSPIQESELVSSTSQINKIEVMTKSQKIDEQNMTLSALLQSLIPANSSLAASITNKNEYAVDNSINQLVPTPTSPLPEAIDEKLDTPTMFPANPTVNWESPDKTVCDNFFEDVDMRSVFHKNNCVLDQDTGLDGNHVNLLSLPGKSDTDYRSLTDKNVSPDTMNIITDMDLSDVEKKNEENNYLSQTKKEPLPKNPKVPPPTESSQHPSPINPKIYSTSNLPLVESSIANIQTPGSSLYLEDVMTSNIHPNEVVLYADIPLPPMPPYTSSTPLYSDVHDIVLPAHINHIPLPINYYPNNLVPPLPPLFPAPLPPNNYRNMPLPSPYHFFPPNGIEQRFRYQNDLAPRYYFNTYNPVRSPHNHQRHMNSYFHR